MEILKTSRLILRPWKEADLKPFAELNADPRVMEYFPSVLSQKESDDLARRIMAKFEGQKWGLWAVSVPDVADFIGFIGLAKPNFDAHFTPAVEVGWRLAFEYWGKGYATEGADAALRYAFEILRQPEIVSFTTVENMRSRRIMEKIGMTHDPKDDFDHPKLPEGHRLRKHVLYRLSSHDWFSHHYKDQKYTYKPYSAQFPDLFKKEKARIASLLTNTFAIEHVGSTAIPFLGGKGIIDIAISIHKEDVEQAKEILQRLGYQFRPAFSTQERLYFIAYLPDSEEGTRRYHIHLTYPLSKEWAQLISFRDYLRSHPEAVEEYANIKKHASAAAQQAGEKYRRMKEPFFNKINALILMSK